MYNLYKLFISKFYTFINIQCINISKSYKYIQDSNSVCCSNLKIFKLKLLKTKIAFEIAQGMEYLRSKGIIHRDLKTANIMLDGDPKNLKPKIGDFGYSRTETSLRMSSMRGTANYMAPEVINGECYDFKADVFSYGMILWELYADEHPFANCTQEEIFDLISSNTKLEFRKLISQDLKDLIESATNFDPSQRPSFTEIIDLMIDKYISFKGNNPAQIEQFYKQKAKERKPH